MLAAGGHEVPGGLSNVGATAIGALSALLAALMGPRPAPQPAQSPK